MCRALAILCVVVMLLLGGGSALASAERDILLDQFIQATELRDAILAVEGFKPKRTVELVWMQFSWRLSSDRPRTEAYYRHAVRVGRSELVRLRKILESVE